MSRSWPRVASPCGGSNLITSAPIQARSCEQVGPACTWVMSRMRTPFSAFITVSVGSAALLFRGSRIERRDAAALGAGPFRDHRVHERRALGAERLLDRRAQLLRRRDVLADAAERLHQLLVARVLHEHEGRRVLRAAVALLVAAIDAVVVEDHHAHRK